MLFIVQFLLAMNYDTFARPQLLLLFFLFLLFIFTFSSAIVHFVQPSLSGGSQVDANPVVMCAFYTDAVTQSARNFGAQLNV